MVAIANEVIGNFGDMEKISKVLKKNSRDAYQISEMKSNRINNRFNSAKKEICLGDSHALLI